MEVEVVKLKQDAAVIGGVLFEADAICDVKVTHLNDIKEQNQLQIEAENDEDDEPIEDQMQNPPMDIIDPQIEETKKIDR